MVRIHVPEKAFLERAISYPHYFPLKATSLQWPFPSVQGGRYRKVRLYFNY